MRTSRSASRTRPASYTRAVLNLRLATSAFRPPLLVAAALLAVLALPATGETKPQFAQAGEIEGVVTKAPGATPVKGVEICAFDVAEDEEFTECTESKSNGAYEILGLDEGPYRVQFKSGESGLNLTSQYYRGAATPGAATIVQVTEGNANTGIDAEMQHTGGVVEPDRDGDGFGDRTQDECPQSVAFQEACPTVDFAPGYSVTDGAIQVRVKSSARTPVAVTAPLSGPNGEALKATKTVAQGRFSSFRLPIPDGLDAQLRRLGSSKSLTLELHARATKVEGKVSADQLHVRLPGRG